jgi:hypothetical protein
MVSVTGDRQAVIDEFLAEFRARRKAIRRSAAVRRLLLVIGWLLALLSALYVAKLSEFLAFAILPVAVGFVFCMFRLLPRVEEALCHRTGFVCPYCHKPLQSRANCEEEMLQRGECPRCFQRIEPPFP